MPRTVPGKVQTCTSVACSGAVILRLISIILPVMSVAIGLIGARTVSAQATPKAEDVDRIFAAYAPPDSPGCVVGVVEAGELVLARGYGMADLEHGTRLTAGSVMSIASVAKQFTASAIAMLVIDGALSLDDDVRTYLPELPDYGSTITVRHLIHHTSGIRNYMALMGIARVPFDNVQTDEDRLSLLARQRALNFEPGTEHLYGNSGYFLLAQIVKRVSGRSLREFAEERIFQPLGMADTHFHDDSRMLVPNRATGYRAGPGGFRRAEFYNWEGVGDVGLMTTVEDLARWDRNFYDNRLGDGFVDAILTRGRLDGGQELDYAFGLYHETYRGQATVGHGGAFMGFGAAMLRFPEAELTAIVLCNVATANAERLARQVADLYLGDSMTDTPLAETDALPPGPRAGAAAPVPLSRANMVEFTGRYYSEELNAMAEFALGDAGLVSRGQRGDPDRPFTYVGNDTFTAGGFAWARFRRDQTGRIEGFAFGVGREIGLWYRRLP